MDIYEAEILETLVEDAMNRHFGDSLVRLDVKNAKAMSAYRDMYRDQYKSVVKVLVDRQRASMVVAWDKGYAFWYENDRPPEHRDYGKGNPYKEA